MHRDGFARNMGSVPLMNDPKDDIEQEPIPTTEETLSILEEGEEQT